MKIKTAVIVFPGSTGVEDFHTSCEFLDWDIDTIWHKNKIEKKYNMIFIPGGMPYKNGIPAQEELYNLSPALKNLSDNKTLIIGIAEGFQLLCKLNFIKGILEKNISNRRFSDYTEFSFLDNDVLLPVYTEYGNFVKNNDFSQDVILKYKTQEISENKIAGVFDYENKIIGIIAHPERAILPKLRRIDGRKVFDFFKNVI